MAIENRENLLKVVLDTNVYISAFNYPDKPLFQIWHQAVMRKYTLLVSPPIIKETAGILRLVFGWHEKETVRYLKLLAKVGDVVVPTITINAIKEDPPDNRILECAVCGQANLIVSGNKHLTKLKVYQDIPIIRPVDFLRTLGA